MIRHVLLIITGAVSILSHSPAQTTSREFAVFEPRSEKDAAKMVREAMREQQQEHRCDCHVRKRHPDD